MAEEQNRLFRKKSQEYIDSPDKLDNYLHVASPSTWTLLASVLVILIGICVWGIFGKLETHRKVAIYTEEGRSICYIPQDAIIHAITNPVVTCEGKEYALLPEDVEMVMLTDETNVYIFYAGNLKIGDIVYEIGLDAELEDGISTGTIMTESISPISLLLN